MPPPRGRPCGVPIRGTFPDFGLAAAGSSCPRWPYTRGLVCESWSSPFSSMIGTSTWSPISSRRGLAGFSGCGVSPPGVDAVPGSSAGVSWTSRASGGGGSSFSGCGGCPPRASTPPPKAVAAAFRREPGTVSRHRLVVSQRHNRLSSHQAKVGVSGLGRDNRRNAVRKNRLPV